jgi:ABC-type transport system involved in cytochrome bd biosynthesis fused ATPase/permease subunit
LKNIAVVIQDAQMDNRSTIYSMIANDDVDDLKQRTTPHIDLIVWELIRLVQIAYFIKNDLKSDLHQPIENELSGGQKTRLLLPRAIRPAYLHNSSVFILDEPDKGLPAETTLTVINNIVKLYRSKGILFLRLHIEPAHSSNVDHVLHIQLGTIRNTK